MVVRSSIIWWQQMSGLQDWHKLRVLDRMKYLMYSQMREWYTIWQARKVSDLWTDDRKVSSVWQKSTKHLLRWPRTKYNVWKNKRKVTNFWSYGIKSSNLVRWQKTEKSIYCTVGWQIGICCNLLPDDRWYQ